MILEIYTKDCKRENLIAIYGGNIRRRLRALSFDT